MKRYCQERPYCMKLLRYVIWILLIPAPLFGWEGKVVDVSDGDSITVLSENRRVQVHLAAVDCPELNQAWGKEAKQFTSYLVNGKRVVVWRAYEVPDGKYFAFVFTENINLNKALLRAGLAWHYREYSRDPLLTALEMEARVEKKGLWSDPNPLPPWEFRKQRHDK
jgi:micrococcal nuclease